MLFGTPRWLVALLVACFPAGFVALLFRRSPGLGAKAALAVVSGLLFAAWTGAMLHFGFGVGVRDVKDAVKGAITWQHELRLERHRSQQAEQARARVEDDPPVPDPTPAPAPPAEVPTGETPTEGSAESASTTKGAAPQPVAPEPAVVKQAPAKPAWPGFRGPRRDGVSQDSAAKLPWPESGPKLVWEQPIGGGHGSFAVAAGRAYTLEQRGGEEVVAAYDVEDGTELWTHRYAAHFKPNTIGTSGPRTTPAVSDGRVYSLGAAGDLVCLDAATGDRLWHRDILADAGAENLTWGMAGSPLVDGGRVYVIPGGPGASVVAYDAATGEEVWRAGDAKAGYASPTIAELGGMRQLLAFGGVELTAYAPEDGRVLWSHAWETDFDVNASQPIVVDGEHVLVSSEYGKGAALLRIKDSGAGYEVETVWKNNRMKSKFGGAVLHDGKIYGPDGAIFACLDVRTGERCWKGGRYGYSFPLLLGDHILIQCENGDLALIRATPEGHQEISRVSALDGDTANHPAIWDGRLLIRNHRTMTCFDLR